MNYSNIIDELFLDFDNFDSYLDHQKYFLDDTPSLEHTLSYEENMEVFKENPSLYEKLYLYSLLPGVHEYKSYFDFCRKFHLFPFDTNKINDLKTCENCVYITDKENHDKYCKDSVWDNHLFAIGDYKNIFEYITNWQR